MFLGVVTPGCLGLCVAAWHRVDDSTQLLHRLDLRGHGMLRDEHLHRRPDDLPGKSDTLPMVARRGSDQPGFALPVLERPHLVDRTAWLERSRDLAIFPLQIKP